MKMGLFWKLFLGFWLTFFVTLHGLWVVMWLYRTPQNRADAFYAERATESQRLALVQLITAEGMDAARDMLASWPAEDRARFAVYEARPGRSVIVPNGYTLVESDHKSPDGRIITLAIENPESTGKRYSERGPWNIPTELVLIGAVGGIAFGSLMAWYLTRPVRTLKAGFESLAQGDLSTRLGASVGRRRDEIADLARDFDIMAARLEKLMSSKQRLLHEISHELRSPLARVQVAIGLAQINPDKLDSSLERIEQETSRLDAMVGELLTLARVENLPDSFEERVDLIELVGSICEDASFEGQASGISVRFDAPEPESPMTVRGREVLLRRAVENIVRNAIRHSERAQTVTVSLAQHSDQGEAVLRVCDEGEGVSPERLETIFEPFVRADAYRDGAGFGLGLAISKRSIEAHDGTIQATNRERGGLCVEIRLPLNNGKHV